MAPLLKYTVFRLALFVAALALLAALGAGVIVAVVGAALISMLLSYLFLKRPREELARLIQERTERRLAVREKVGEHDASIEDAAVDAQSGAAGAQVEAEPEQRP